MTELGGERPADFANPLARAARERPHHPALICGESRLSYRDLEQQAAALAGGLAEHGVGEGERVAVLLGNEPLYAGLLHAALGLGATLVPLNTRLTERELRPLLAAARPRVLVCGAATQSAARGAAGGETRVLGADELQRRAARSVRLRDALDPTADQAILFTSGTTGLPKGVRLSIANQWASARASAERLGSDREDRWLLCMPLYHVGGLAIALRAAIGAATVVLQERFDADPVQHALERQHITHVSLVPTMLSRMLRAGHSAAHAARLRCVLLGGGPIAPVLARRARAAGYPVAGTYGLTEAASQVATSAPHEDLELGLPPLARTELRIASQSGADQPPDTAGEIWVRGPQIMQGYLDRPHDSAQVLREGWLRTGDFGQLCARGRLRVLERRTDLIVSGGENVYPSEVEAVLLEHPQVREAAVVGRSDPEWGQRVEAVLVCEPRARAADLRAALLAHCAAQLAGFKCPRAFHFADALPRTASGKLRRDVLRGALEDAAAADSDLR